MGPCAWVLALAHDLVATWPPGAPAHEPRMSAHNGFGFDFWAVFFPDFLAVPFRQCPAASWVAQEIDKTGVKSSRRIVFYNTE